MGKKHFCFFQTAETRNRTPNSGVKGSGSNHYPRAPAHEDDNDKFRLQRVNLRVFSFINVIFSEASDLSGFTSKITLIEIEEDHKD